MKSIIPLLLIAIVIFSGACKKEDAPEPSNNSTNNQVVTPPPPPPPPYANYWGCWRQVDGNTAVYDIILTEDTVGPHVFEFATSCVSEPAIPPQAVGVFRNDTLILDNGMFEYWCFIENDTLIYSAYIANPSPEKFVKI